MILSRRCPRIPIPARLDAEASCRVRMTSLRTWILARQGQDCREARQSSARQGQDCREARQSSARQGRDSCGGTA
eukprot:1156788-Pelagomonas_calceolata.AAC.8